MKMKILGIASSFNSRWCHVKMSWHNVKSRGVRVTFNTFSPTTFLSWLRPPSYFPLWVSLVIFISKNMCLELKGDKRLVLSLPTPIYKCKNVVLSCCNSPGNRQVVLPTTSWQEVVNRQSRRAVARLQQQKNNPPLAQFGWLLNLPVLGPLSPRPRSQGCLVVPLLAT